MRVIGIRRNPRAGAGNADAVHAMLASLLRQRTGQPGLAYAAWPVISGLWCSAIQRPVANCWNSVLSSRRGVR